ncbi:Phosphatidate phosphatase APP1 [Saccharicrinis carchari]|uniref:Phosphatidate phosphatase APP1 n=1 Tax=Saccharicrinis carchari TaxID=1168039 RepID=A0A521CFW2_SACCC|nr:phosphatase domain-containing protein [Saccharicrinis carchari]SMO58323.1 Phosphatidate phosphatase APP1 [Saccharicrinis carchari]
MQKQSNELEFLKQKKRSLPGRLKVILKHRLGWLGVPKVIIYRGFCSEGKAMVSGCLTEDKGLAKPDKQNSTWQNILSMIKRYSSDQIPGAKVRIELANTAQETLSNDNGLFSCTLSKAALPALPQSQWVACKAVMPNNASTEPKAVSGWGEVLIPGTDVDFGVISDIDDTILVSHSTQFLRKLRLMLLRNALTRKPFPGVDAFYRALSKGVSGGKCNPFFYISSSEWALYDLLVDFCAHHKLPKGVFLLREFKAGLLKLWKSGGGTHEHKFEKIDLLFKTYPNINFVLIGDNGQHDTDIYTRIARKYPKRVITIYIRTVKKVKNRKMKKISEELWKEKIPILFTPTTLEAAHHAADNGLISPASVTDIAAEV